MGKKYDFFQLASNPIIKKKLTVPRLHYLTSNVFPFVSPKSYLPSKIRDWYIY